MNNRNISCGIWSAISFIIAALSTCLFVYFLILFSVRFYQRPEILIYNLVVAMGRLNYLAATFIGVFGFARLGIRMLNTGRKFFEMPKANNGPLKIAGSILLTIIGTTFLISDVWVINDYVYVPLTRTNEQLSATAFLALLFLGLSILLYYLAYKLKKSAFIKEQSELFGEII